MTLIRQMILHIASYLQKVVAASAPYRWMRDLFWIYTIGVSGKILFELCGWRTVSTAWALIAFLWCAVFLFLLSDKDRRYVPAAACVCGGSVLSLLLTVLKAQWNVPWLTVSLTVLCMVVQTAGICFEFGAHRALLQAVDRTLSTGWKKLWLLYIGMSVLYVIGLLLGQAVSYLNVIALLADIALLFPLNGIRIYNLYRTACAIRKTV